MNFGKIDQIMLLGGSPRLAEIAHELKKDWKIAVFTCKRQLEEVLDAKGTTLEKYLEENKIDYFYADDINTSKEFTKRITPSTLAIGIGEAWTFTKQTIDKFDGRLVDFMGIRLPHFRGGAHYTWQLLQQNRMGCCNIQEVNAEMIPGAFDSGRIIKRKEFFFSAGARTPLDYFNEAGLEEKRFILEFVEEIKKGLEFRPVTMEESFSLYMPRLNTKKHGFVNWNWETDEIERFICAFDDPYVGATTFVDGRLVRIKKAHSEFIDGKFHPFQAGIIYRIHNNAVFVATRSGSIVIKEILDENGVNITNQIKRGSRLYTPQKYIEDAMLTQIEYDTKGIKNK
ncbi:hypothetical protein HY990_03595 [Candidatus Micrarchaeota archaeon]|nr:hypothetical protein [Candidatus Micrarchaeota archaeon]